MTVTFVFQPMKLAGSTMVVVVVALVLLLGTFLTISTAEAASRKYAMISEWWVEVNLCTCTEKGNSLRYIEYI